ncbi:hypothetical protein ABR28_15585 [Enterobacter hormaechei subsp. hoffmannii]|uniref:ATP-grasp fold amidoligase family protein n=1 Tax=Enterobacter hormaechei TaxID=158836 RepID=UPI000643A4ED|nr:ATP-grasp fold amidoligase family protein [Enterobacter hormaechei]KLR21069.1 hypothetical protein ABR28_15585 [Enterobacter hormaechei subsp. hoffmannii]
MNKHYRKYILRILRHCLRSNKSYRIHKFRKDFGFYPDISHPVTFNEKILCRMISPERPDFMRTLADKLKAREYVGNIKPDLLPELYGIYKCTSEIDFSILPDKFVLKCNHDSGSVVICTNKGNFNARQAKSKLALHMKMNMYFRTREWQYKQIPPRIICEEYIDRHCLESLGYTPDIFRFHCFNSEVKYVEVEYQDDKNNHYTNIYDNAWNIQPVMLNGRPNVPTDLPEPARFDEAIGIAETLSENMDYCRVDLYITSQKVYFSEFTFSPGNGREQFFPDIWDSKFGDKWLFSR